MKLIQAHPFDDGLFTSRAHLVRFIAAVLVIVGTGVAGAFDPMWALAIVGGALGLVFTIVALGAIWGITAG